MGNSNVTVQSFVQNYGITFPILMDNRLDISRAYQVSDLPTTYFIKPDGTVSKRIVGGPLSTTVIRENMKEIAP